MVRSWWLLGFMVGATTACARSEAKRGGLTLESKLPVSFTQLSNVVELHDGRIVFADTRDRLFLRGDMKSGKLDTLGKRADTLGAGAAPSLYKLPGWVAHLAGDTVALVDFAALRTTLWTESGEPVRALLLPPAGGPTPVLAYDQAGFGYKTDYQAVVGGGEPGRTLRPDSVAVLRIEIGTGRVDTVAQLAAPEYGDATFGEQVQQVAKIFGPTDVFGVLPDGRVWVARARENRIDWRGPGGVWIRGEPRKYTKVPVTQADKDRVIARIREQGKGHGLPDSLHLEWPFAETKPPFETGASDPKGQVWLQRSRDPNADEAVYDVYATDGSWKEAVAFPKGVSLAGFGSGGTVYGIIKNGDLKTVGRYKLQ